MLKKKVFIYILITPLTLLFSSLGLSDTLPSSTSSNELTQFSQPSDKLPTLKVPISKNEQKKPQRLNTSSKVRNPSTQFRIGIIGGLSQYIHDKYDDDSAGVLNAYDSAKGTSISIGIQSDIGLSKNSRIRAIYLNRKVFLRGKFFTRNVSPDKTNYDMTTTLQGINLSYLQYLLHDPVFWIGFGIEKTTSATPSFANEDLGSNISTFDSTKSLSWTMPQISIGWDITKSNFVYIPEFRIGVGYPYRPTIYVIEGFLSCLYKF